MAGCKTKLDTDAEVNVLPIEVYNKIANNKPEIIERMQKTKVKLEIFGGYTLNAVGQIISNRNVNKK